MLSDKHMVKEFHCVRLMKEKAHCPKFFFCCERYAKLTRKVFVSEKEQSCLDEW